MTNIGPRRQFDAEKPGATHWRQDAACRGVDPEVFFSASVNATATEPARRVCRGCPVKAECLVWAIETGSDYGVFGGLDQNERAALQRRVIPARS